MLRRGGGAGVVPPHAVFAQEGGHSRANFGRIPWDQVLAGSFARTPLQAAAAREIAWPSAAAMVALVQAVWPPSPRTVQRASAVARRTFGIWVFSAWFTHIGAATGHLPAGADEYGEPPLWQLEQLVPEDDLALLPYFARRLTLPDLVVEFAAALAVLGDWAGLDELAAAAVQTFLAGAPPVFVPE